MDLGLFKIKFFYVLDLAPLSWSETKGLSPDNI